MNMHKVMLLSLGFLMMTKTATLQPELENKMRDFVGLRCEFNGMIQFSLSPDQFSKNCDFIDKVRAKHPEFLYDATPLQFLKTAGVNHNFIFECNSSKWVWLNRDTFIELILMPDQNIRIYDKQYVYFYNVFDKILALKLTQENFEELRDKIYFGSSEFSNDYMIPEWTYAPNKRIYYVFLYPKHALKYPVVLKKNLTLETVSFTSNPNI